MPGSTISATFVLEEKKGVIELTEVTRELGKAFESASLKADQLQKSVIRWSAVTSAIQAASNVFRQLQGTIQSLSSAYDTQVEAERLLENNMRNTMNATDEEIQSIKELTAFFYPTWEHEIQIAPVRSVMGVY